MNITMNPLSSPLIIDTSSAANQVPPSASKESELTLDERIEQHERELCALQIEKKELDLAALIQLKQQQTPQ